MILGPLAAAGDVDHLLATAVRRGRATPLEADQARRRVTWWDEPDAVAGAGLVVADAAALRVKPSAVVADLDGSADHPRAVGCRFVDATTAELRPAAATCPDAVAALADWLPRLGVRTTVVPADAGRTTHRVAA